MAKPRVSQGLSDEAIDLIAARFKVLSDPLRLKLIAALDNGEKNVTELIEVTQKQQTNISRQLQVLADAGILARRREGACVYYRIVDPAILQLCRHVCGSLREQFVKKEKAFAKSPF